MFGDVGTTCPRDLGVLDIGEYRLIYIGHPFFYMLVPDMDNKKPTPVSAEWVVFVRRVE